MNERHGLTRAGNTIGHNQEIWRRIADLIELTGGTFAIAADTEYEGVHTLTSQFAVRNGQRLNVQVYHSPALRPPARPLVCDILEPIIRQLRSPIRVLPFKLIDRMLSPVQILADLLSMKSTRSWRPSSDPAVNDYEQGRKLTVALFAHFLPADFFRVFGVDFYRSLIDPDQSPQPLRIQANKQVGFKATGPGGRFADPRVEYAIEGSVIHPVHLRTFDTNLPFGAASLDEHAKTFLGVGKLNSLTLAEKQNMLRTFRSTPAKAFAYAVLDSVLTLLISERMDDHHRNLVTSLALPPQAAKLRPTQGARVADLLLQSVAKHASGAMRLSRSGPRRDDGTPAAVSMRRIRTLFSEGSSDQITISGESKFGKQTGETHGGLLFSRWPTMFCQKAPGRFRDIDLQGCYAENLSRMHIYIGRPVIYEPGAMRKTLSDAIAFVREHAAADDAWIIKVSGPIRSAPNVLIPSTHNALTNANYRTRAARRRANTKRQGFSFDWLYEFEKLSASTTIYTDVIEAGIVAFPTWLMIQVMPPELRNEYETLQVDSILFYPHQLVADNGPAFDELANQFSGEETPWCADVDMTTLTQTTKREIGEEYVALRYDVGTLARRLNDERRLAQERSGRGSGMDLVCKQTVNTLYGVLASPKMSTNNVIAANYITATARAVACAMQQALNGVQVITDGCTYRTDQIPRITFRECLAIWNEYPINRNGPKIPSYSTNEIPIDDGPFTSWFRQHVKQFFEASDPAFDQLFGIHHLEHKLVGAAKTPVFDGLCCDGSGNNIKLLRTEGQWQIAEFKARGYGKAAKRELAHWIASTYMRDKYAGPPPVTRNHSLLTYKEAGRIACSVLADLGRLKAAAGEPDDDLELYYPLGLESRHVQAYKIIKPSAYLFRTPQQRDSFRRAADRFAKETGCGFELLALRRSTSERRQGSIRDIAALLYAQIRRGVENFSRELNLSRDFAVKQQIVATHVKSIEDLKKLESQRMSQLIDARTADACAALTGLRVSMRYLEEIC